jgi:chromosome partitioning protein
MSAVEKLVRLPKKQRVLLVACPKGGAGKSTLALNILTAAVSDGIDAAGISLDDQHNFEKWGLRRKAKAPYAPEALVVAQDLAHYKLALDSLRHKELVVIDTPPGIKQNIIVIRELIELADFVLIPAQPTQFDLESAVPFFQEVERIKKRSEIAFVLNRTDMRSIEVRDAMSFLGGKGRVCPTTVRDLKSVPRVTKMGLSCIDIVKDDDKGKRDMLDVWIWLRGEFSL